MGKTELNYKKNRIAGILILFIIVFVLFTAVFSYGIGVGRYQWFPFSILKAVKDSSQNENLAYYQGENWVLPYAFTDPIIRGELLYKPIESVNGIFSANSSSFMDAGVFFNAYDGIEVLGVESLLLDQGKTDVLHFIYKLSGMQYDAYAYQITNDRSVAQSKAALVIPGSGENQSSAIYRNDPSNYHFGIIEILRDYCDVFVLIKPNEDILAFHNGHRKLNDDFIINWHLNRGSSYSARYIVDSMAITKYMKQQYNGTTVAGLSQGGLATLLNVLQSQPDKAIISSGYSAISPKAEYSRQDQIIIPSVFEKVLKPELVFEAIKRSKTDFLFSYGIEEISYSVDVAEQSTCRYLSAPNVKCVIHAGGHSFPAAEIANFLDKR